MSTSQTTTKTIAETTVHKGGISITNFREKRETVIKTTSTGTIMGASNDTGAKKGKSKKKSKGFKKVKNTTAGNDTATLVQGSDAQGTANNNGVAVPPPLSKTAKKKLKAQDKAIKAARAAQLAAAAKEKKTVTSTSTDDGGTVEVSQVSEETSATATESPSPGSDDVVETPTSPTISEISTSRNKPSESVSVNISKDATFEFGNGAAFAFGNDLNIKSSNVVSSHPASGNAASRPTRKPQSWAKSIRKHQENDAHVIDGSKPPRGMVPVKAHRKPLPPSAKKDHKQQNPLMATMFGKKDTNLNCALAVSKFESAYGVKMPNKPLKQVSWPLAITNQAPAAGPSVVEVETASGNVGNVFDFMKSRNGVTDPAPALSDTVMVDWVGEDDVSKGEEHIENIDDQQDEYVVQDTPEVTEQTSDDDVAQDIVAEQVTSPSSPAVLETTPPAEENVVEVELPVHDTPAAVIKSELNFLSFPNAAEFPPVLLHDAEQALVDMHVTPLQLPTTSKKISRSEKKFIKAKQVNTSTSDAHPGPSTEPPEVLPVEHDTVEVTTATESIANQVIDTTPAQIPDHVSEHGSDSPSESPDQGDVPVPEEGEAAIAVDEDTFVPDFLALPNGPGKALAGRQLEEKLVALHVAPFAEPPSLNSGKKFKVKKTVKVSKTAVADAQAEVWIPEDALVGEIIAALDTSAVGVTDTFSVHDSIPPSPNDIPPSPPSSRPSFDSTPHESTTALTSEQESAIAKVRNNAYLGITSLDEFLGAVITTSKRKIYKDDICSAFGAFAAAECDIFLGYRPTHLNNDFDSVMTQCKTKMGATSLYKVLKAIAWKGDVASVGEVVRVFKEKAAESDALDAKMMRIAEVLGGF